MRRIAIIVCLAAAFGCSTVRQAREIQNGLALRGSEISVVGHEKLDLRGSSLEALVDFALTNRPSVISARLAVRDARLALKEFAADAPLASAMPWAAPKLSLSAAYGENSSGTTFAEGEWQTKGDPSAALSLDLLLWDAGRNVAKLRAQSDRILAAERTLSETGYLVFDEVASAYFTYLERSALLEVARMNANEYAVHLKRAEARFEAGEAQKLDVLKARLDLVQATETVVAASNLVETSGATLMGALGVDVSRGTYFEVIGPSSLGLEQSFRAFARSRDDVDGLFALARTNAPSMRIARARLRAASADVDYAVADLLPKASASLGLSWSNPLWYWNWGVNAAQSLFQGFRKRIAVERAVVALESASATLDRVEQDLSLEIEVAVANRDNSLHALETARASVVSARENLEVVRQQVEVGAASRIELSAAIASYSTAVGSCVTAFYDGQRSETKLFRLTGRRPVYREACVKTGK